MPTSPEAASVVERVTAQVEANYRNGVTAVRQSDLRALLAVVEAAKAMEFLQRATTSSGNPFLSVRRSQREDLRKALDALYSPDRSTAE